MSDIITICHACLSYHEPPLCRRDWLAPCRCCERPRGPGSEAGEDVCGRCFALTIGPIGAFVADFGQTQGTVEYSPQSV